LAKLINEAFVSRNEADEVLNQLLEELNVVRARGQQRKIGNHAQARDSQAEFEAIVGQVFGGAMPVVGVRLETAVAATAREDAHYRSA
jgi:hypothetical protein